MLHPFPKVYERLLAVKKQLKRTALETSLARDVTQISALNVSEITKTHQTSQQRCRQQNAVRNHLLQFLVL